MRRINRYHQLAVLETTKESLSYEGAYGRKGWIESWAKSYVSDIEGRKVLVDNPDKETLLVLNYITRFSDAYYYEKVKEIKRLQSLNLQGGVFLTLTIDPKKFNSLKEAYKALMKGWNKLLSLYRYRIKKAGLSVQVFCSRIISPALIDMFV